MVLKVDEYLFLQTNGQIEKLEDVIREISNKNEQLTSNIFGAFLPLHLLLVNKKKAYNIILSTVRKYWGDVDLFLQDALQTANIDLDNANDRLHVFFSSPQGKKAIFDYLLVHHSFHFENLVGLVFGKDVKINKPVNGLSHIYLYKIGKQFFIHIVFNQQTDFWNILFTKKVYSIFMQATLSTIQNPIQLMKEFKYQLERLYTLNQSVVVTNQLIHVIDYENPRSFQLKELHLFNIITHFNGGKRHHRKLNKLISEVFDSWEKGKWALTEKEQTLLTYILAIDAAEQHHIKEVILYGQYLINEDRLNNHAIELLLEYGEILPNLKPEPSTLVKRYDKNYLEQIFFILINALVQNGQFIDVIILLKEHEIASCTSIYDYYNGGQFNEDSLHRIEATVQRDIAYIVDNSPQHVLQSIDVWLHDYQKIENPYSMVAEMTSKHVCNLLKALFATKEYDLFEKLMEIYKKYLKRDNHFENLKNFVACFVKS